MLAMLPIALVVVIFLALIGYAILLPHRAVLALSVQHVGRRSYHAAWRSDSYERARAMYHAVEVDADPPDQAEDADEVLDEAARGESGTSDATADDADEIDAIGQAAGLSLADGEPVTGLAEIDRRDAHRWELDPESADEERPKPTDEMGRSSSSTSALRDKSARSSNAPRSSSSRPRSRT
jgi:hypothetical protein